MKNSKLTYLCCYAAIFIIWLTSATKMMLNIKAVCFAVFFFASGVVWYFIKNKKVAVTVDLIITLVAVIYSYEYIFVVIPVIFLILSLFFVYQEKDRKNKSTKTKENIEWSNLFVTASVLIFLVKAVYAFIKLQTNIGQNTENLVLAVKSVCLMMLFFIVLIIATYNSGRKGAEPAVKALRKIYIVAALGLIISVFYYYAVNPFSTHSPRIEFVYWLTIIIFMATSGDPTINLIFGKSEKAIKNDKMQ